MPVDFTELWAVYDEIVRLREDGELTSSRYDALYAEALTVVGGDEDYLEGVRELGRRWGFREEDPVSFLGFDDEDGEDPPVSEHTFDTLVHRWGLDPSVAALHVRIASGELEGDSIGYASIDDVPDDEIPGEISALFGERDAAVIEICRAVFARLARRNVAAVMAAMPEDLFAPFVRLAPGWSQPGEGLQPMGPTEPIQAAAFEAWEAWYASFKLGLPRRR